MTISTESAGGIILNQKGEICIANQQHYAWSLPKGHIEANESLEEAAKREIYEETGLQALTLITYLGHYSRFKMHKDGSDNTEELKTLHFYLYHTNESTLSPKDPDNPIAKWVSVDDAIQLLTHAKDKAFVQSHQSLINEAYKSQFLVVTTTTDTHSSAIHLANLAVSHHYAACAQIEAISSIYSWKNKMHTNQEYRLTFKTHTSCYELLESLIQKNHAYDTPQMIAIPVKNASDDYLKWISDTLFGSVSE